MTESPPSSPADATQDAGQKAPWDGRVAWRGRVQLRTLVALRWIALAGQAVTLAVVGPVLGFSVPYGWCLGLIAAGAWVNLLVSLAAASPRPAKDWEAAVQLTFDILQLSALLFFTGGVVNPFSVLLIAPATLAASILRPRYALALGLLAVASTVVMSIWHWPLPWKHGQVFELPLLYNVGLGVATVCGILLTAGYAGRAAMEAARMELALNYTQMVLAREQRLSALGGLAAAAAHELGTPLATISIVAREMAREAPEGPARDDAQLLISQAERCREILRRLTEEPETGDIVHARMSLLQLVNEVIEPHLDSGVRVEAVVTGSKGARAPEIRRLPEVLHAMTSLVENATDFAVSEVLVTARFDEQSLSVEVRDDGPGFSPEVMAKLGQPYVTSRPGGESSRSGHVGMGLGFFIAKTLLERTGARFEFSNGRPRGAVIVIRWPRARIEAPAAE